MTRIKFILEDGRKIYWGGFVRFSSFKDRRKRTNRVYEKIYEFRMLPRFEPGEYGAYSPHLVAYYSPLSLRTLNLGPSIKVVSKVEEDTKEPLDPDAFVLGGAKAVGQV